MANNNGGGKSPLSFTVSPTEKLNTKLSIRQPIREAATSAIGNLVNNAANQLTEAKESIVSDPGFQERNPQVSQAKTSPAKAVTNTIVDELAKTTAATKKAIEEKNPEAISELKPEVAEWTTDDGGYTIKDKNNNGILDHGDIDQDSYNEYVQSFYDKNYNLALNGVDPNGPNTFDEAIAAGLISQEQADKAKKEGQTYHDLRFGPSYKVLREEGNTGDSLQDFYGDEEIQRYYMDNGAAVDIYDQTAKQNAMREANGHLATLFGDNNVDISGSELFSANGVSDPYNMTDDEIRDVQNSITTGKSGNPFYVPDDGQYVLDMKTQNVKDGATHSTTGLPSILDRLPDLSEYEQKEQSLFEYLTDPTKDSRSRWEKMNTDEDDSALTKLGKFFTTSTQADGDGNLLTDVTGLLQDWMQFTGHGIRDLDKAFLPEETVDIAGTDVPVSYINSNLNAYMNANENLDDFISENGRVFNTAQEAVDAYNAKYGTNLDDSSFDFSNITSTNYFDPDTEEILYTTNDTGNVGEADWEGMVWRFPNGASAPLIEQSDGTAIPYIKSSYNYDEEGQPAMGYVLKSLVPEGATEDELALSQALQSGTVFDQSAAGLKGKYEDYILDDNGLNLLNMIKHPIKSTEWVADTALKSAPYMIPIPGVGLAMAGSDAVAAANGYNVYEGTDWATGEYEDPGLLSQDAWEKNTSDTFLEGAFESLLGYGQGGALGDLMDGAGYYAGKVADKVLPWRGKTNDIEEAVRKSKMVPKLGAYPKEILRRTNEEGVEEAITSIAQNAVQPDEAGLRPLVDEDGYQLFTPWGEELKDETTPKTERAQRIAKELLDSYIGGGLVGGGIAAGTNAPSALKAKTKPSYKTLRPGTYEYQAYSPDEIEEIKAGYALTPDILDDIARGRSSEF